MSETAPAPSPANAPSSLRPRDRDALVAALRAGVVPRQGLRHVAVGRAGETEALLGDARRVAGGGAALRVVVGEYGSGKSFLLSLAAAMAREERLVTAWADLSPEHRLHSTQGHARALVQRLAASLSTRARPDGGALPGLLDRAADLPDLGERLDALRQVEGGHDAAAAVLAFRAARDAGDEARSMAAERWWRAEYETRAAAREDGLGVRGIVDDAKIVPHLRCLAELCRLAGTGGLMVVLDECVNISKLQSPQARSSSYEQVLGIVNAVMGGQWGGIGFLLGATPAALSDTRRGMFSYEALRTRLAENELARAGGLVDLSGPVIRLAPLRAEDLYVLLGRLDDLFPGTGGGDPMRRAFLAKAAGRLGDAAFRTPRLTIKSYLDLLAVLDQNPGTAWRDLLPAVELRADGAGGHPAEAAAAGEEDGDDMATFRL